MNDFDLDSSNKVWSAPREREKKLANKQSSAEEKLIKNYFFTQKEITTIFDKHSDGDAQFYNQIIRDVEQQYATMPMGVPINDYLYDTLMSIQPLHKKPRKHRILRDISRILAQDNQEILSYEQFIPSEFTEDDIQDHLKKYIKNDVLDFYVVSIDDAGGVPTSLINNDLKPGMDLYVFIQKDGQKFVVTGPVEYPGDDSLCSLDDCLHDLAQKYNATKVSVPLSHFSLSQ